MSIIKVCEHCGETFEAKTNAKKYCSNKCKNNHTKRVYIYICIQCGKEFQTYTKDQKYCNHKCYEESKYQYDMVTCECCSKVFHPKGKRDNHKFCSRECYRLYVSEHSILTFKCKYCGNDFEVENGRKYIYDNGKKQLRKYCSKECTDKARVGQFTGSLSAQWKGGVCSLNDYIRTKLDNWKRESFETYNYTCVITGEVGGKLVVHHSKPFHVLRDEIMNELDIEYKEKIGDYTEKQLKQIIKLFKKKHEELQGIPMKKDIHVLFHSLYGFKTSIDDVRGFKNRYLSGEFNSFVI